MLDYGRQPDNGRKGEEKSNQCWQLFLLQILLPFRVLLLFFEVNQIPYLQFSGLQVTSLGGMAIWAIGEVDGIMEDGSNTGLRDYIGDLQVWALVHVGGW